jgi:FkbM family methyltransferase
MSLQNEKTCVYTCLIGDYEELTEQATAACSKVPFICLTDNPHLESQSWSVRYVKPVFPADPVRSQRHMKILPHLYLADYQRSLYIDNTVQLTKPPEEFLDRYQGDADFALPHHSFRESILDEFIEVARGNYDEPARIMEQLNHYLLDATDVLAQKPFFSGILMRRHGSEAVRTMLETWASHVMRYSRRDQLSFNIALRMTGFIPKVLAIDTFRSDFHIWPVSVGRERNKGNRDAAKSMMPLAARVRELELTLKEQRNSLYESQKYRLEVQSREAIRDKEVTELQKKLSEFQNKVSELQAEIRQEERNTLRIRAERDSITSSLSWKVTSPLRKLRDAFVSLTWKASAWREFAPLPRPAKASSSMEYPTTQADVAPGTPAAYALCGNGRKIYVIPEDLRAKKIVEQHGDLNPISLKIWRELVAGSIWTHVIDIGANYGEMLVNIDIPAHVHVVAVEPNPKVASLLQRTLKEARLGAEVLKCAVSDTANPIRMTLDHTWSGLTRISGDPCLTDGHVLEHVEVPCITLDRLIEDLPPGHETKIAVKIDVEGHEVSVLASGLKQLSRVHFASMIEIIHLSEDELAWLLSRFSLRLYDMRESILKEVEPREPSELKQMLKGGNFYRLDAVLGPKTDGVPSAP